MTCPPFPPDGEGPDQPLSSLLPGAPAEVDVHDALGIPRPTREIKNENKPIYAIMAVMRANGSTNTEIAKAINMNRSWVSIVVRQKWFIEKVLELQAQMESEVFHKRMKKLSDLGQTVLEDVMGDDMATNADKIRAADIAIKHAHGLPVARVQHEQLQVPDPLADLAKFDEAIKELEGEIRSLESGQSGGSARDDIPTSPDSIDE